jgi:hypothetical protein
MTIPFHCLLFTSNERSGRKCSLVSKKVQRGCGLKAAKVWGLNRPAHLNVYSTSQEYSSLLPKNSLLHTINSGIPDMFLSSIPNSTITLSSGRFTPYKKDNHTFMVKYPISLFFYTWRYQKTSETFG